MTHNQATIVAPHALVLAAAQGVRFGGRKLDALCRGRPDAGFAALLNPAAATTIDIPRDNPDIDTIEDLRLLERTSG